jgi:hypothetical protein
VTCRLAPTHEHLHVAGGNELAVNTRSRPVVLVGKCHRLGGELSQLNEIRELQPLEINVSVHGRTMARQSQARRDPVQTIARLRRT